MPGPRRSVVVASDGVALAVREHGDPSHPTVVLVHGYPDTQELWSGVVARLRDDHHVVSYDVRGAGESDAARSLGGYALTRLSDDLLAVIEATTDDGRAVHLVGHDWGAIQSWESAARRGVASRLSSFTAVAGPSLDLSGHAMREGGPADGLRQLRKSWYILAFHAPLLAPLAWRVFIGRRWPFVFSRSEGVRPPAGHPAPTIATDGVRGIGLYRRNMLDRLLRPRYARVDVPLVQVGVTMQDAFIDPATYDGLPGRMPELWIRRAEATHWIPVLHPDVVSGWVRDVVAHRERGTAPPPDAEVHREAVEADAAAPSRAGA
ncbi:alpha/beta fold hydrolase [Patulibacter sp.]|uniref:alpha/beta fold hydrolase n=1 Tax=Patulibacter sp. TaxID=1912859 RepID=UPI002724534F|nr:alpha/beta fold hydrolase [Patulibacter sp.]MDO9410240.1 alpha/beta fold hydrolase [Patulibacter sp.]